MNTQSLHRGIASLAAAALVVAACGDDDDGGGEDSAPPAEDTTAPEDTTSGTPADTTAGTTGGTTAGTTEGTTAGSATPTGLADVCPDPLVIQTDWFPEAEHGALYQMLGDDVSIDAGNKIVSGPLVAGEEETGIDLEIRAGGPAIGNTTVAAEAYADENITLTYANTEAQALQDGDTPLVSVIAPLEINPQIIYWDPETYPNVETLADLGEEGVTINVFGGGVFSEVFVANGTWSADQVDPSYDGSPARFISEDGAIAQQGFASAEPYQYENEFDEWGKPLAYQLLHDAGFEAYSQTLAAREADLEELAPCFERFVPIVQQAAIDYINDPAETNEVIIETVAEYDTFWVYEAGVADYSVETQKELGLVGNGPDSTLGNMDEQRVQGVLDQMREAGQDVPADLQASDIMTNEFIDESIGV